MVAPTPKAMLGSSVLEVIGQDYRLKRAPIKLRATGDFVESC